MSSNIFREKALERLSSPDNVQEMVQITSARSWLALLALLGLTLATILWGFLGNLPKTTQGHGILIQAGGIAEITATGEGVLDILKIQEGQKINKNDTIAIIAQPELELELKNMKERLEELSEEGNATALEINDLRRNIEELEVKLSIASVVLSPYAGTVIELMSKTGQLIERGVPLISIEIAQKESNQNLEAVIYLPPEEGKKVSKGMAVRLAPSTVKTEEFGYIIGKVSQVSEYPSTRYGMLRVLGNPALVESFLEGSPPIAITVSLQKEDNLSGFAWTSRQSPPDEIKTGTLCNAQVIIDQQRPISLLLPFLREKLKI